jgi:hypothetical protein
VGQEVGVLEGLPGQQEVLMVLLTLLPAFAGYNSI